MGFEITISLGVPILVSPISCFGDFEAHLIALSCSEPPEGFARWSLRLLADKIVEMQIVDSVSHETVRSVLKKRLKTVES